MKKKINHFYIKDRLKVIYAKDNSSKLVSIQLFIRMGSAYETDEEAGYSHLMEHLVFKSTENYPNNTLMDAAASLGTILNAYTEYESTCFYLTVPSEYLKEGIELLYEIAFKANFSDREFKTEKKVVIEELKQYQNDPEDTFIENIPRLVLKDSPYKKLIIGNLKSLKKATTGDLREFYKKYYYPENMFLIVAGDIELELGVGSWELGVENSPLPTVHHPLPTPHSPLPTPHSPLSTINYPLSTSLLAFVLPELADSHPFAPTMTLIGKAFAMGNKSRLYQRLFLKEKLVDNIKVHSISGNSDGVMIILVHPRRDADIERIIKIFLQEFYEFSRFGIPLDEIEQLKREILLSSRYIYEYMENLGQAIGSEELLGDYRRFFDYEQDVQGITAGGVREMLDEYYNIEQLRIVSGGKVKKQKDIIPPPASFINVGSRGRDDDILATILPTGLKIFLKKVKNKPICGVSLALGVSQLNEEQATLGLNQLTSTLLLYGNKKRDYLQCQDFCSNNGIQFAVSCGKETTKLRFKCFTENLFPALSFLSDVLFTPTFPKDHLENLKQSVSSNINRIKDYPHHEAIYLWKKMIFGSKSNLLLKEGNLQTLKTFNRKKIEDWYFTHILKAPATLCIIGDIDFDDIVYKVGSWEWGVGSEGSQLPTPIITSSCKKKIIINRNLDQSIINLGGFCNPEREKRAAWNVLSQIIGGDIASRMFTLLREKYGIAYSVDFDYNLLEGIGYYDMFTIVDKKAEKLAIDLLYKIQEDIKRDGVTADELEKAKKYLIGQAILGQESVLSQAQSISSILTLGYDYEYYLSRTERVKKVKNEDIICLANKYFHFEEQFLHILH